MSGNLISTREAAEILGKAPSTIARLVERQKLTPAIKGEGIRGAMWFDRESVEALKVAA